LLSLAKKYDTSDNQTMELRSSKPTPRQDKQKKGKAGGGGNNPPVEEKKIEDKPKETCKLCGKDGHWAFDKINDYSKPYGDHVNWTCPDVGTKSKEVKQQVWDARVSQYNKRKAKRAAREAAPKK
jgi:hypothetical protein